MEPDIFDIIQSLSDSLDRGETLSAEELMYCNMAEEVIGIAINQLEYIRVVIQGRERMR